MYKKLLSLTSLISYPIYSQINIKKNEIEVVDQKQQEVFVQDLNGKEYPFIIAEHNDQYYCVFGIDPSNSNVKLSDGIIVNGKIKSPTGAEYNLMNGKAEQYPAINDLPIFQVQKIDDKYQFYSPENFPKYLYPEYQKPISDDLRKVVIVGGGIGSLGVIESLRQNGFSGQITLIKKQNLIVDKDLMRKNLNLTDEQLYIRNQEWYNKNGVQVILGQELDYIHKGTDDPYIFLENKMKIPFDGLVLNTGSIPYIEFINQLCPKLDLSLQNVQLYNNLQDYKLLQSQLQSNKIQNLSLLGLNWQSMELASTIKKQYPQIQIDIFDLNQKNFFQTYYGFQFYQQIKEKYSDIFNFHTDCKIKDVDIDIENYEQIINNDIQLNTQYSSNQEFENFIEKLQQKKDLQYKLANINVQLPNSKDKKKIISDHMVIFPNSYQGNVKYMFNSLISKQYAEMNITPLNQIKVNQHLKTDYKRIYAIGSNAIYDSYLTNKLASAQFQQQSFQQGYIVGYNILSLHIPYYSVPFQQYNLYHDLITIAGENQNYNQKKLIGDLNSQFQLLLGDQNVNQMISNCKIKDQLYFQELLRLQQPVQFELPLEEYKSLVFKRENYQRIGCFREEIYKQRESYILKDVLWQFNKRKISYDKVSGEQIKQ